MSAPTRTLLRATLVLASLALLAAVLVGPAGAAAPTKGKQTPTPTAKAPRGPAGKTCWNALIRDWYDGRIDKTYEVHCYRDALKHLPQDVRTYSDAYDVISRALADATRGKKRVDPDAEIAPPGGGTGGGTTTTGTGSTTTATAGSGPDASGGPIGGVLNGGDQGANGVPIPLLVLAGLAVLLVAAGGAGLAYRRYQGRRG